MATRIGGSSGGVRVHVAAFGKHPGWDDHIENIGVDSDRLVWVKRVLYTEGLAGNIDSGAWERLEEAQRLPAFAHVFVWRTPDGTVVGRMWSSRDGKGRTKYPMVVCALVSGASAAWAVQQALPRLAEIEQKVKETQSAEIVRLAVGEARRTIEDAAVKSANLGDADAERTSKLRELTASDRVAAGGDVTLGLTRVLYEIDREMGSFRPSGGSGGKSGVMDTRGQHLRAPTVSDQPGESSLAWLALTEREVSGSTPVLLIEPLGAGVVDVIVGEPTASTLFCVRSASSRIPPATEVPYNIDDAFATKAAQKLESWRRGQPREAASTVTREAGETGSGKGLAPWLIIAGVLATVAIIMLLVLGGGEKSAPSGAGGVGSADGAPAAERRESRPTQPGPMATGPGASGAPSTDPRSEAGTGSESAGAGTSGAEANASQPPEPAAPPRNADAGDPRAGWRVEDAIASAESGIQSLRATPADEVTVSLDRLSQSVNAARDRASALRARAWDKAQRDEIAREMASVDAQVTEIQEQIRSAQRERAGRVREYLLQRGQVQVAKNPDLQRAWEGRLRQLDPAAGMQSAQSATTELETAVRRADQELSAALPAIPDESSLDAGALQSAASTRRDAAVRAVAAAIATGDVGQMDAATGAYREWLNNAQSVVARGLRAEAMLRDGFLPAQRPGGSGDSIDDLLQGLGNATPGSAAIAVQPLVRRAESIRGIYGSEDVASVLAAADRSALEASGRGATEVLAAWDRLAAMDWPRTPEQLARAAALRSGPVESAVGSISDTGRRGDVTASVSNAAERMWLNYAAAAGQSEEGLAALQAQRGGLGITEGAEAKLPAWVRYNLARLELQRSVRSAFTQDAAAREDASREAARAFLATASTLGGGVLDRADVAPLMGVVADAASKQAAVDLSGLGPAKLGWRAEIAEDGAVVTYIRSAGREERITFNRADDVQGAGESTVSFVSTEEVSLGLFNALASDAGVADTMRRLMPDFAPGLMDPRSGMRTWEWSRRPTELVSAARADTASRGWLRKKQLMEGRSYYPAGVEPAAPDVDHPMTWTPPVAAAYLAHASGCRLPTESEWRRCVAAAEATAGANRRDASWSRVAEHVRGTLIAQQPDWPSGGIFWPEGVTRTPVHEDTAPAVEGDDGSIWTAAVGQGSGTYKHLIGNVAEYVVPGDPIVLETLTPEAVEAALVSRGVGVVGGSAISPPAIDPMTAYRASLGRASSGYSDVGFRLAFTAPKSVGAGSFSQRLQEAMEASGLIDGR